MVKEYWCLTIEPDINDTERKLDKLGRDGWKLICSYGYHGKYLIMERDKKVCPECKK